MEPMSLKARRTLAVVSSLLFILILPIVALYASGYRLDGFSLVSTGGIHIAVPVNGTSVYLNGVEKEHSSIFNRSFFFDDLTPGSYVVQTALDGYVPWSKTLVVEPKVVTDVSMVAIRQPLHVFEIMKATTTDEIVEPATSTMRFVTPNQFEKVVTTFTATSTKPLLKDVATSTTSEKPAADSSGGVELRIEKGDLYVVWRKDNQPPAFFCVRPSFCTDTFTLEKGGDTVTDATFFGGGVLYRTRESGVYFAEVDIREPRLLIPIYGTPGSEFRIVEGSLYVKDKDRLFEIEL